MPRSGAQARLATRRGQAGAEASARSPKKHWPLRKVVGSVLVETQPDVLPGCKFRREALECGHLVPQAKDLIGDRYPARRRCRECAAAEATEEPT
jgi:hypothetical protein